jgi:hypothetical protein
MKKNILFTCILGLFSACQAQDSLAKITVNWKQLADGVFFCETDATIQSKVNDSKISILKVNPKHVDFDMLIATEKGRKALSAPEWADSFNLNIVINAGMYDLSNKLKSKGYLKNHKHVNQSALEPNYNAMIAFNAVDTSLNAFTILDLKCDNWQRWKTKYHSFAQGLRMLDCVGEPMSWNKRKQSCSMLVTALDEDKNVCFIFTRSPYTHNQMIQFMQQFPFKLTNAIYMEGGPQTSMYIKIGDTVIEKIGSYVSETYAHDNNDYFWKLPNVIGIKVKK